MKKLSNFLHRSAKAAMHLLDLVAKAITFIVHTGYIYARELWRRQDALYQQRRAMERKLQEEAAKGRVLEVFKPLLETVYDKALIDWREESSQLRRLNFGNLEATRDLKKHFLNQVDKYIKRNSAEAESLPIPEGKGIDNIE